MQILVDEWRHCWKAISVWVLLLIGAAPDIHAAVVSMGWLNDPNVPPTFVWILRGLAVAGVVGRYVKQRPSPKAPE